MIEVSFALPKKQIIIPVLVPAGICVKEAIELSGILKKFTEIDEQLIKKYMHKNPTLETVIKDFINVLPKN